MSLRSAQSLVSQLQAAGILAPASGKYRRSALYQADDLLSLLAFAAEGGRCWRHRA